MSYLDDLRSIVSFVFAFTVGMIWLAGSLVVIILATFHISYFLGLFIIPYILFLPFAKSTVERILVWGDKDESL